MISEESLALGLVMNSNKKPSVPTANLGLSFVPKVIVALVLSALGEKGLGA
jgi:hypothetical protein